MPGPGASVLLRAPVDEGTLAPLRDYICSVAREVPGEDFWVDEWPFMWRTGEEYPGEL